MKMNGGLGWIRVLRGKEQDMSSLALEWEPFSSFRVHERRQLKRVSKYHVYLLFLCFLKSVVGALDR